MSESEAAESPVGSVQRNAGAMIGLGIALIVLGILAVGAPLLTGLAVAITVAAFVVVSGILQIVVVFKGKSWGKGILGLILGFLTLLVAIYLFSYGTSGIIEAFQLKPAPDRGWSLFSGILTVLLGAAARDAASRSGA